MQFLERKVDAGYTYDVEDIFGKVHITAPMQVDGDTLDDIVVLLLKQKANAEHIDGSVKLPDGGEVRYTFERAPKWLDEEDDEPCDATPTLIQETGAAYMRMLRSPIRIWNWCKRFAAALREAYRKASYPHDDAPSSTVQE